MVLTRYQGVCPLSPSPHIPLTAPDNPCSRHPLGVGLEIRGQRRGAGASRPAEWNLSTVTGSIYEQDAKMGVDGVLPCIAADRGWGHQACPP